MRDGSQHDDDWSVAPTFAWFVVLLAAALLYGPGVGGVLDLIDRAERADAPRAAGPTFVQHEATRQAQSTDQDIATEVDVAASDVKPVRTAIEDVCLDGTATACTRWAMDGYYEALARVEREVTRITLWGDSVTAEGHIAGGMRERLVAKHGDGGAGFVFLAKPSRWYQNTAVRQAQSKGWVVQSIVRHGAPDGMLGYGGAAFTGTRGDTVTFRTAKAGAGSRASKVEVYYLERPETGGFEIVVDGEVAATIDTERAEARSGFAAVDVDDGAHTVEVRVTGGAVRFFGIALERDAGVVVDSLGIVSSTTKTMAAIDRAHWQEQLAHRDADLMMILLGTNEGTWMSTSKTALAEYQQQWEKLLARMRKANPRGSCLVLGTLDSGALVDEKYVGREAIAGMVAVERAAARAHGCAFWDARAFMGGKSSARKWQRRGLMSGDFEHLTGKGGRVLGGGVVDALEAGYAGRRSR